jgi:D-alanyl-D-alanine carboxypeptidase
MTRKKLLIAIVFLVLGACKDADVQPTELISCTSATTAHPKSQAFQAIMDRYKKMGLPGITVLVEDSSGSFIGAAGYADLEEGIEFTPCHPSKAASITKLMVGVLTFQLQEEGILDIDDPISDYIDSEILDQLDNAEGVTIRECMNHTTGIFDLITSSNFYLAVINNPNKEWRQEELLEFAYNQGEVVFEAPFTASYSNTNTALVSMCIEKATGRDHGELLREKILEPLSMNNTYYQGRENLPNNVAQGYFDLHNNGTIVNVSNMITGSGNGYGGVYSNVEDLNVFIRSLFLDKTILSEASLLEMQDYFLARENFYTGAGMVKKFTEKTVEGGLGHTGRDLGYSADLFYFPGVNASMAFFVNYGTNGSSNLKEVFEDFESELADEILR